MVTGLNQQVAKPYYVKINKMEKLKYYLSVAPVFSYFVRVFSKDKEGKYPVSTNLKMMHGINKISIVLGLVGAVVIIYRLFFRD